MKWTIEWLRLHLLKDALRSISYVPTHSENLNERFSGILLITFAEYVSMLFIGRLLYGFSSGAFGLLVPSYTSETAEPAIKGALGSLQQLIVTLGVLFVGVLGKYVDYQLMTGIFLFIPVLMTLWMFFMPESPVFLVSKGRMEAARSSLLFLRGPRYDVDKELLEIQSTVRESQEVGDIGLVSLLTQSHYRLPLLLSVLLMFLQQFSGVNAVLAYSVQLFEDTGVTDTIDAYTCNILVCLTQFLFVIVSMTLVDRNDHWRTDSQIIEMFQLQVWEENPADRVSCDNGCVDDCLGSLLCGEESD